jgi:hypothetical protein
MRRPSLEGIAERFGVGTTPRYSGGSTRLYLPRRKSSRHTVSEFEEPRSAISRHKQSRRKHKARRGPALAKWALPAGRVQRLTYQ